MPENNEVKQRKLRVDCLADYDSFVDSMWFYDPAQHSSMPELGYTALALCGEVGEIAEKVKKYYRDGSFAPIDGGSLVKELGDVLFYLVKLAHIAGVSLDDVAKGNVEKLQSRMQRSKMRGSGDDR